MKKTSEFTVRLSKHILDQRLFPKDEVLLCAVSGGMDSMVLADSLLKLGHRIEIAHVNFQIRGADSDKDEELVRLWANHHSLPFHLKRAGDQLKSMKGSLQENARDFRYSWLEQLAEGRGIRHLVLAHHADDQTETILMQFFRGAGAKGLQGMQAANGLRRRPLLPFSKTELKAYALQEGIIWREDASNAGNAYRRNQVRHYLIPLLQELFPGFDSVLLRNAERIKMDVQAADFLFDNLSRDFLKTEKSGLQEFHLDRISAHPMGNFFIKKQMLQHGFTLSDAEDFCLHRESTECRFRTSKTGILAERKFPRLLFWTNIPSGFREQILTKASKYQLELPDGTPLHIFLSEERLSDTHAFSFPLKDISFPVCFRKWKSGDRIAMQGMQGKMKKVSDLLTQEGLTLQEKKQQIVLEDACSRILWISCRQHANVGPNPVGPWFIIQC